jgi:protein-disulfide isomerase
MERFISSICPRMRVRCAAAALALLSLESLAAAQNVPIQIGHARGEINKAAYFEPGLAPVRVSGPYDVTVVYFMDYQCPACRKWTPDVARAFSEDHRVRVIYRDSPIFGERSREAAKVAIASQFQGKHEAMHSALMASPMPLDDAALKFAAAKAGVDWERLQRDLAERGDQIDLQIAWNMELAQSAGIAGTPAFIVGDVLADGVLDYEGMKGSIADARRENSTRAATAKPGNTADSKATQVSPANSDDAVAANPADAAPAVAVRFDRAAAQPAVDKAEGLSANGGLGSRAWLIVAAVALLAGLLGWLAIRNRGRRT